MAAVEVEEVMEREETCSIVYTDPLLDPWGGPCPGGYGVKLVDREDEGEDDGIDNSALERVSTTSTTAHTPFRSEVAEVPLDLRRSGLSVPVDVVDF